MNIITLDFETYYSDDFTLQKMTTEEYIRDPRFEVHGCGVRFEDGTTCWYPEPQLRGERPQDRGGLFASINWANTAVLCHHVQFDGLILSHVYGVIPKFWFDTLSMARLLVGNHLPKSLDALAKHFMLGTKNMPYNLFKNKHWHELDTATQNLVANGCCHDVELTWQLFQRLGETFPLEEYELVDITVRMFTEPTLIGDTDLIGKVWHEENQRKNEILARLGFDVTTDEGRAHASRQLQSAALFQEMLEARGVEIEYKDGKNGPIPAFGKKDQFMLDLLDDADEEVAMLAAARVEIKSTGMQTRAETLGNMAMRGALCVYLNYCGAHTTRWSGGDGTNFQNFKRKSDIRKALVAP